MAGYIRLYQHQMCPVIWIHAVVLENLFMCSLSHYQHFFKNYFFFYKPNKQTDR